MTSAKQRARRKAAGRARKAAETQRSEARIAAERATMWRLWQEAVDYAAFEKARAAYEATPEWQALHREITEKAAEEASRRPAM